MKFDFYIYTDKVVMHCKTKEEADDFCKVMDMNKMKWCTGESYINNTKFDVYQEHTCYVFMSGEFSEKSYFESLNYKIIEWSDFMNKGEKKMNTCMDEMKYLAKLHKNTETKKNTLLAEDVDNVIFNGNATIVTLNDGRKGISKCDNHDEFDPYNGYVIAYYKAKHDKNFELKKMFNGCIEYSKKKGYKQTVVRSK